ncbi:MAG: hypothetical protein JW725_04065 [Candidatus Babeliaceae bacterium]|nr:hypothetical protein [Candidatus Babeliaceae bacterium]
MVLLGIVLLIFFAGVIFAYSAVCKDDKADFLRALEMDDLLAVSLEAALGLCSD